MTNELTPPSAEQKYHIWEALTSLGGANRDGRDDFMRHWPGDQTTAEYRFIGNFGFGGKIWWNDGRVYVSYYQEDRSEQREAALAVLNDVLTRLMSG